jgi:type IV pilus assembly PilX-like protein
MTSPSPLVRRPGEEGAAYLVALLALVILTIVGLNISLVTQTEMKLGDHERSAQRVFYAAEAGFSPAVSKAILDADYLPYDLSLPEAGNSFGLHNEVEVSAFFPILASPCDLCEINNAGAYGTKQYFEVTHAVTAKASRVGPETVAGGPIAQKTISVMIDIQPSEALAEAQFALIDSSEIKKIRF